MGAGDKTRTERPPADTTELSLGVVRNGLVESVHRASAVAVDESGRELLRLGDVDAPVYYRSAIKPVQALVSLSCGIHVTPEEIAVIASSHGGSPVHVALVRRILTNHGVDETDLRTPPDWPFGPLARRRAMRSGSGTPQAVLHNCSGKHAGWLAACRASGWDTSTYVAPEHPIQVRTRVAVADATGVDPEPAGVDGCGAPTWRGSLRGLARSFAHIVARDEFAAVAGAMSRFPELVAGNDRPDGRLGAWWPGPMKAGAEGLLAAGKPGLGVAVKSFSGSAAMATSAMIEVLRRLGALPAAAVDALGTVAAPPVMGGGRVVGRVEIM